MLNQENTDSCNIYCNWIQSCDNAYIDCGDVSNCTLNCTGPSACSNAIINATRVTNTFTMKTSYDFSDTNEYLGEYEATMQNSKIYCPINDELWAENCRFICQQSAVSCGYVAIYATHGRML